MCTLTFVFLKADCLISVCIVSRNLLFSSPFDGLKLNSGTVVGLRDIAQVEQLYKVK